MPARQTFDISRLGFIADYHSITLNPGRQIDWASVPVAYANAEGDKVIPSGTAMSQLADGKIVPRVDRDVGLNPSETAIGLLVGPAIENDKDAALSGYGVIVGGVVYGNILPDSGHADWGTIKTELDDAGTGFLFEDYADSRAV